MAQASASIDAVFFILVFEYIKLLKQVCFNGKITQLLVSKFFNNQIEIKIKQKNLFLFSIIIFSFINYK